MYVPPILHCMVFSYLFLAQTDTNAQTQNLCFNISFHLYIHDQDLEQAIVINLTCGVNMYVPLIFSYCYILWFSVTFSWLNWIPIHQNLWFNIPFHLYIHDQDLEQAIITLTHIMEWTCMYPQYWYTPCIVWFSVTFSWFKRIPMHKQTQNLCFNISFHLNHLIDEPIGTLTSRVNTYVPPI